jgi:hypothetical protein
MCQAKQVGIPVLMASALEPLLVFKCFSGTTEGAGFGAIALSVI